MIDRQISAGCVVAYALWGLCVGLWASAWLADSADLGRLALIVCGTAVTATIRTYFVAQSARIRAALAVTSYVRDESTVVRPMR